MTDGGASKTLLWSKADLANVIFQPAKRLGNGGMKVDLEYQLSRPGQAVALRQKIRVQTPRLRRVMIGESKYKPGKWTAAFACNGHDTAGSEVHAFLEKWLKPFEAQVRRVSHEQSLAWFKKELETGTLEAMYNSCIKPPSETSKEKHGSDLAPLLKCSIESSPSRIELDVYRGPSKTPSSLAEFRDHEGRKEVVAIMDLESVWFMGMQFGVTPVLRSLWYFPEDRPQGFAFVEDDEGAHGGTGSTPLPDADRDLALRFLDDQPPAKRQKTEDAGRGRDDKD